MPRSGLTTLLLAGASILAVAGCGDDPSGPRRGDVVIDRVVPTYAESLAVPGWSFLHDSLEVRVAGIVLNSSCYDLERVDIEREDRTYTLHPFVRHLERYGYACLDRISYADTTLVLRPPDLGMWWVRVFTANDTLVDSTEVLVDETVVPTLDSMEVPRWSFLDDHIGVRLVGVAEPSPLYRLATVEVELEGRTFTLHPLARPCGEPELPCESTSSDFDTTIAVTAPDSGRWWVRALASNGTFVDSTLVLIDEAFPAWVDLLSVPEMCYLEDGVDIRLTGAGATVSCLQLAEVGIEREGRTFTLRPLSRYRGEFEYPCQPGPVLYDTTFVLYPPGIGPWWITVVAVNGTFVDSTKVTW